MLWFVEHAFTKHDGILMFHKFRRVLYFVYIDDTTSVLLKFPDGKREKLTLPVTSQLMVTYFVIILSKRSCFYQQSCCALCMPNTVVTVLVSFLGTNSIHNGTRV